MGNRGTSLNDVFKEMAEQEALEHGMIIISMFIFVDNLSFAAHQLSLLANEPNDQAQSSRSELLNLST